MSQYRCSALLASAALVLGAALTPSIAFADDPTTPAPGATVTITNDELVAALKAAEAPTAAAGAAGWVMQGSYTEAGSPAVPIKAIYAVDRGLTEAGGTGTVLEAQHTGTYLTLSTFASLMSTRAVHRALKAIKKPHAAWVFMPDKSLDLHNRNGYSAIAQMAPDAALSSLVDPSETTLTGTPTKSVAADGTATYSFSATDLTDAGDSGTVTLTTNANGVLTGFSMAAPVDTGSLTYAYGAQQVSLPAKSRTVTLQRLSQGFVLAKLPQQVKQAAQLVAHAATRNAHRHRITVTVAAVRSYAGRMVKGVDRVLGAKIFSIKPTAGGVRITGTNRFNHTHVSYSVTAAGKKAVVHKG